MKTKRVLFIWWIFLSWLLVACSEPAPDLAEHPVEEPTCTLVETLVPEATATARHATISPAQDPVDPSTPAPEVALIDNLCSPLTEHNLEELFKIISDPYQPPPMGSDARHQGVDFSYYQYGDRSTIEGMVVQAILPGTIVASIQNRIPYGNMLIVAIPLLELSPDMLVGLTYDPGEVLYLLYAHMLEHPELQTGDAVEQCEPIGKVGRTGGGGGYDFLIAHLHLEARLGPAGAFFVDMAYYDTSASETARDNYRLWRMSGLFRHFDPLLLFSNALGVQSTSPTP
jgi:murein DD-endopeptidase MepM/ murein hydrolase activator NlpD